MGKIYYFCSFLNCNYYVNKRSICEYNVYKVAAVFLMQQYNSNSAINGWQRMADVSDEVLSAGRDDQFRDGFRKSFKKGFKKILD